MRMQYDGSMQSPLLGIEKGSGLSLEEALDGVFTCRRCRLSTTRTNVVPGEGRTHARVMLIGEAPGKNEDLQGRPFVGAAGKLLDQLLVDSGLTRSDIYIANILKCRPPKNRDPRPEEIETCTPWLVAQIESVFPHVIVTMGNFSTRFILGTTRGISSLRGTVHQVGPFSVVPTFHPAAAIYDRNKVPVLQRDFARIAELIKMQQEHDARKAAAPEEPETPAEAPDDGQSGSDEGEQMQWNFGIS